MTAKLFVLFLNFCLVSGALISLETELGLLIGQKREVQNKQINVFYGVPYAEPPVGKLRFRRTTMIKKFPTDPYAALSYKARCPQQLPPYYVKFNGTFDEDCLHANIWTPNLEESKDAHGKCKKLHNVMIYIYGGKSFIYGQTSLRDENGITHLTYSGELFSALHDTILVTFNYRHDLLATMVLEKEFSGNLALFDQNVALQFVKKYIGNFCGDSEKLTVFGNSYGASCLSTHLISRYSRDLINNAVLQSSSNFFTSSTPVSKREIMINSFYGISRLGACSNYSDSAIDVDSLDGRIKRRFFERRNDQHYLKASLFVAELKRNWYNFESKLEASSNLEKDDYIDPDVVELIRVLSKYVDVDCLQRLPIERLIEVEASSDPDWSIYYDLDFIDTEAFFEYKLFNRLKLNPKVNILTGIILEERGAEAFLLIKDKYYYDQFSAPAIPKEDAQELIKDFGQLKTEKSEFRQSMADYYTNESMWSLSKGYYESFNNLFADDGFNCPVHFWSYYSAMSQANSVSNYVITYQTRVHFMTVYSKLKNCSWLGSSHADELWFLFGLPFKLRNHFNDLDRSFALRLLELWIYFSKNGRMPKQSNGKEWPISNKHHPAPRYVEINNQYAREWKFEFEDRCESFFRPLLPLYKR